MKFLHNRVNKQKLREQLYEEEFDRVTLSFYRYVDINDPDTLRDELYKAWDALDIFGRIYVAHEGINAQMTVPEHNFEDFKRQLQQWKILKGVSLNIAYEDDGKSFFKLTIKVRDKIVADGLEEEDYDFSKVGRHLSPEEFHEALDDPDTIVMDMRNFYEVEVGRFEGAEYTDADSFKETLPKVKEQLKDRKDKKVLLYCTGGIRCEKASAYLKENGIKNVYQLQGGITHYAKTVEAYGWSSKFKGKNFTFDERLGEKVTDDTISKCHQCGKPSDRHVNCNNEGCHLLFIQCEACEDDFDGCCSPECQEIQQLPKEERKKYHKKFAPGRNVYNPAKNPYLSDIRKVATKSNKKL